MDNFYGYIMIPFNCINNIVVYNKNETCYICLQLHYAVAMGRGVLCPAPYPPSGLNLAALAALHQDRLLTKSSSIADLRLKAKKHAEAISRDQEIV